jgi:Domain of unknown function (DUF4287)
MSYSAHSEQTHQNLIARIPEQTGRPLSEWFSTIEDGPALARMDERANWLSDEYNISHGYATAIFHEYDKVRAARRAG